MGNGISSDCNFDAAAEIISDHGFTYNNVWNIENDELRAGVPQMAYKIVRNRMKALLWEDPIQVVRIIFDGNCDSACNCDGGCDGNCGCGCGCNCELSIYDIFPATGFHSAKDACVEIATNVVIVAMRELLPVPVQS